MIASNTAAVPDHRSVGEEIASPQRTARRTDFKAAGAPAGAEDDAARDPRCGCSPESADDIVNGEQLRDLHPQQELALRRRLGNWSRGQRGVSAQDFDDIYQDAWCKLLEGQRQGRRPRNVERVLRWAIRNGYVDAQRRRQRRQAVSLETTPQAALVANTATDPAERAEALEATRCLLQAVDGVTERQRQIIMLADLGGMAPAAIQKRLGISERTYQRDHARALQTIGTRLGALLEGAQHRAAHSGDEAAVAA